MNDIETVVQTEDIAQIRARWPALDKTWTTMMVAAAEIPAGDAETAAVVTALEQRKAAAEESRRALSARARADHLRQQQHNLAALDRLAAAVDASVADDTLRLGGGGAAASRGASGARQAPAPADAQ